MKSIFLALTAVLSALAILAGCASSAQKSTSAFARNDVPRDPPRTESELIKNDLKGGLSSLKGRKVGALLIFNLPDSYLLRAKAKINPPDFAVKEVMDLQSERVAWLSEAVVTNCDACGDIEMPAPLQILPEALLLRLIDHISLRQPLGEDDWKEIHEAWPDRDVIWLILGREDYEQKRGPSKEKHVIAAWSESSVDLHSFVRDFGGKKVVHEAGVTGRDEDLILYEEVRTEEKSLAPAKMVSARSGNLSSWEPKASPLDHTRYDDLYPYPPVPESPLIIRKALLRLTEMLSP